MSNSLRFALVYLITVLTLVAQNFETQKTQELTIPSVKSAIGASAFTFGASSNLDDDSTAARQFLQLSQINYPATSSTRGFFVLHNEGPFSTPKFVASTSTCWVGVSESGQATWVAIDSNSGVWHRFKEEYIGGSDGRVLPGEDISQARYEFIGATQPEGLSVSKSLKSEVKWTELYPGVESTLRYNDNHDMERWFTIAPHQDASIIHARMTGATLVKRDNGGLHIITDSGGSFLATPPHAFQTINGKKHSVEVSYVLLGTNEYGFEIGDYDHNLPLLIDPVITSTVIGGASVDRVRAMTHDAGGDVISTGETSSPMFPIIAGAFDPTCSCATTTGNDMFVSRFSSTLQLISSTFLGGNSTELAQDVDVTTTGEVTICGSTSSTDFPAAVGGTNAPDGFIIRLDSTLSTQIAQGRFGNGAGFNSINAVKENIIGGAFGGQAWVASLNATFTGGTQIIYTASGMGTDIFNDLIVDSGTIFAAGSFGQQAILVTIAHPVLVAQTGFLTDFGLPAAGRDEYLGAALQSSGTVALCGSGDANAMAVIARFSAVGGLLSNGTIDASGSEAASSIAALSDDSLVITGFTNSVDFPVSINAISTTNNGATDVFVSHLDANVSGLTGSTYLGGAADDRGFDVLVNAQSSLLIGGATASSGFPLVQGPGGAPHDLTPNGLTDGFIAVVEPIIPVIPYDSFLNPDLNRLTITWDPAGGDTNSPLGVLTCSGATPGALGLFAVGFVPADFLLPFGFPLLVSDNPNFLIDTGGFGFSFFGDLVINVSRQSPIVAGFHVYIQFYETFPIISGSNGLKVLVIP